MKPYIGMKFRTKDGYKMQVSTIIMLDSKITQWQSKKIIHRFEAFRRFTDDFGRTVIHTFLYKADGTCMGLPDFDFKEKI